MKIGILTFHCAHNYGATLQAYALKEYIKTIHQDVEIVNYVPSYFEMYVKEPSLKDCISTSLCKLIKNLYFFPSVKKRNRGFANFIKNNINPSSKKYSQKDTIEDYDVLIYGSDQIWNGLHTNGPDNIFWGYLTKPSITKIVYATSSAESFFTNARSQYIKNALLNFQNISVREKKIASILSKHTTQQISHVIDPVFLLPKEEWETRLRLKNDFAQYVLVYQVRENPLTLEIANDYAKKNKLRVVVLTKMVYQKINKNLNQTASPIEFVNLIKNAALIVTTSFHGTAFSIIFKKNFYTVSINPDVDERSLSLLQTIKLKDRLINRKPDTYQNIKYDENIEMNLNTLISDSKYYLKNAIL